MYLFHLLRSFLPLHNPIGFGASDFIELAIAALLAGLVLGRAPLEAAGRRLASKTLFCMLLLAILPVALRLALLSRHPVPTPAGSDDFSHLLAADTLLHLRLANPPHPLGRFFEAIFILQEPSYSSIFPMGQGLALALGRALFGHPWAGVVLSVSIFCALCYWMLRAWTTPSWALIGGLLAVCEFGPLGSWMNTYWGGAVSAIAGCLVFGALPRLRAAGRTRDAALLGLGLALQIVTRPFEAALLLIAVAAFWALSSDLRRWIKPAAVAALVALPAIGLTMLQNRQATGNWITLPYMLSRYQYGVPTTFTFQPNPVPHRAMTAEQQLDYEAQSAKHGAGPETLSRYLARYFERARIYRFFFPAPLYFALPFFLLFIRERRYLWIAGCLLLFSLGTNFYPYFYPHYIAAVACLLLLAAVASLERLSRVPRGPEMARWVLILCAAHFLFWYGLHACAGDEILAALRPYESWDVINWGDPEGRIAVDQRLARAPGRQLVFVRYWPSHLFHEWIHNAADIDQARVVWAADLGPSENRGLQRYYRDRTAWLIEPDAHPPKLQPYPPEVGEAPAPAVPATQVEQKSATPAAPKPGPAPKLSFEPVPQVPQ